MKRGIKEERHKKEREPMSHVRILVSGHWSLPQLGLGLQGKV